MYVLQCFCMENFFSIFLLQNFLMVFECILNIERWKVRSQIHEMFPFVCNIAYISLLVCVCVLAMVNAKSTLATQIQTHNINLYVAASGSNHHAQHIVTHH